MKLFELFSDDDTNNMDDDSLGGNIQQELLDVLTPFVAQKVPFVTIQQVIDKLREFKIGINLDRGFVMNILDPNKVKAIQKIEGDKIYLNTGGAPDRSVNDNDKQREQDKIKGDALKQAQKNIKGQ